MSQLLRTTFTAALLLALGASSEAALSRNAGACVSLFSEDVAVRAFKASHTLSQEVRDNAPDYYRFSLEHAPQFFGALLDYKGLIVGDTHPGNFIIAPVNGELRFHIADLKDAGVAPYVLDFARLVISTHAIYKRVDERPELKTIIKTLFEAYNRGLNQLPLPANAQIDPWILSDLSGYNELSSKYVAHHTKEGKFEFEPKSIEPLPDTVENSAIKKSIADIVAHDLQNATVLDYAIRPRDRGGSKELLRYWALVKSGENEIAAGAPAQRIVEFKEIPVPAVASYAADQLPTDARYKSLMKTFWQTEDPNIRVVRIGDVDYLMRRKKIDLLKFSYSPKTPEERDELMNLTAYDAHYLGLLHARQLKGSPFVNDLALRGVEFEDALHRFTKTYLDHLKTEIKSQASVQTSTDDDEVTP